MAVWRRPKLTARGEPDYDHVVAGIVARLIELPRRSVVLAEDETHLNLLPDVRASWTLRGARPHVLTSGTNRKVTVAWRDRGEHRPLGYTSWAAAGQQTSSPCWTRCSRRSRWLR